MPSDQPKEIRNLSIGIPSTLGSYYDMCLALFGRNSEATKWIKEKLDEQGADEEVVADEGQMIYLLVQIHLGHP
jgi:hypothetical protein